MLSKEGSGGIPIVQWTSKAKEYVNYEKEEFAKEIERNAVFTLMQLNQKRLQYGLPTKKRIDIEVLKETVLNLINDTTYGDASRTKNNFVENKGGMYQ